MKYLISVYLLLIPLVLQGQKVHKVKYESQADLKVYIVEYESQCDLKVFFVEYESQANEAGLWFFVEYESQAGWKNPEKQHLLF